MTSVARAPSPFGEQLRCWRKAKALSQLELATRADTTPRHLSFIETGRSRPGRDLVMRLAQSLDVPLRDQNTLLVAAGFGPAYPEGRLDEESMRPLGVVIDKVLANHEPYPAWVMDRRWKIHAANRAAERLFPGLLALEPIELIDRWFAPGPFRDAMVNGPELLWTAIDRLRAETQRAPDADVLALLRRAEAHAVGVPRPAARIDPSGFPVACPHFRVGDQIIRTITAVLTFENPREVTTSELRVELMFPGDDASDVFLRALAGQS